MIERRYRCDLCSEQQEARRLVGLFWEGRGVVVEKPANEVEHHICCKCLASVQKIQPRCGAGFKNCNGGPNCDYDHK